MSDEILTDEDKARRVDSALFRVMAELAGDTLNEQALGHTLAVVRFVTVLTERHKALLHDTINEEN